MMGKAAQILRMDAASAMDYVTGTSRGAKKLMKRAGHDAALAAKYRQRNLGIRYGAGALGLGVLGSQPKNRSSYRPPRPNTQTARGSGRYA